MTHSHRVAGLLVMAMLAPRGAAAPMRASARFPHPGCSRSMACALPHCTTSDDSAERLWCVAAEPDSVRERPRILAAIERIRLRGGVCEQLAGRLTSLQQHGRIRLYDPEAYPGVGGAVPVDPSGPIWLLLSRDLVSTYYDAAHRSGNVDSRGVPRPETLQSVLAHEADHLAGAGHVDRDGYLTPNSRRCGAVNQGESRAGRRRGHPRWP
jgi:hypothetical protein